MLFSLRLSRKLEHRTRIRGLELSKSVYLGVVLGVFAFRSPIITCNAFVLSFFGLMLLKKLVRSPPLFVGLQYAFVISIGGRLSGLCMGSFLVSVCVECF